MNISEWIVIKCKKGQWLCMSKEDAKSIIEKHDLKDYVVEMYSFDDHCKYILKLS